MCVHRTAEAELLARLREAHEAVRARDDFIAVAAHELRSPMNALSLRLQALERMASVGREGDLVVEIQRMRRSVERYVRRAVVLLDVSRLNAGPLSLAREEVRIAELVRNVVDSHQDEAAFHGAVLRAEVAGDPVANWDPHMVEQILTNLVTNAFKYGGGTPVTVRAAARDGSASLAVSDGGPGIAPEQQARIFEKFERVVPTPGDRAGYGLGLWIVGKMVAAHGGSIDIGNAPGGGARFVVNLPLGMDAAASEES